MVPHAPIRSGTLHTAGLLSWGLTTPASAHLAPSGHLDTTPPADAAQRANLGLGEPMARYLALIEFDAAADAYGLVVPDFPGCNAMGATFEEAEANGVEALREWAADTLAESDALPRARTVAELRQDPSLFDDFTPETRVIALELQP